MKLRQRLQRISLSKKIVGAIVMTCLLSTSSLFYVQYSQYARNSETILSDLERSVTEQKREDARDILREVMFATEGSLQRGESVQFMRFAKQQAEVEEIEEFSFYGKAGKIELSSHPELVGNPLDEELWKKAQKKQDLFIVESHDTIEFYHPLHVDADMRRLHPDWQPGELYGVLHLEFSKAKINRMLRDARAAYQAGSRKALTTVLVVIGISIAVAVVLALWVAREIMRPVRRCLDSIVALSKQDFGRKCDVDSHDELGRMATAINQSIDATKKAFDDITEASQREKRLQEERAEEERNRIEEEKRLQAEEAEREHLRIEQQRKQQEEQA